jgi:hypothetical protein
VKDEEASCRTTPEESQITPLVEETKPINLLPETIIGDNYPEAELYQPQTKNSQNVGSTENVDLNVTEVVPSVAMECCTSHLAPAVTSSDRSTASSSALSESEMDDNAVTYSITEKDHDPDVPGAEISDGIATTATLSETKNLDGIGHEEEIHALGTESNAKEATSEVTLSETTTKEVNLLQESHESGLVQAWRMLSWKQLKTVSQIMRKSRWKIVRPHLML